ncbi:MAG: hypothetical protein Q9220_001189 [cf. Caloplaca sp. 1 TL-2023]
METEANISQNNADQAIELSQYPQAEDRGIIPAREVSTRKSGSILRKLQTWWSSHVALIVVHSADGNNDAQNNDPRDYLALERTYLAHVRTANALALFGVTLLQLFRLHNVDPKAGLALGALSSGSSIFIIVSSCRRYFLQQKKLTIGKAVGAGPDVWLYSTLIFIIIAAAFIIVLVKD